MSDFDDKVRETERRLQEQSEAWGVSKRAIIEGWRPWNQKKPLKRPAK